MILPPFFGVNKIYDDQTTKELIIEYLSNDTLSYKFAYPYVNLTYQAFDAITFIDIKDKIINNTYLSCDTLSIPKLSNVCSYTYLCADILSYDPPPAPPETTIFLSYIPEDSQIYFEWNNPYNNRCNIIEYTLEYSDKFLSIITNENFSNLNTEDNNNLIEEFFDPNANWQIYNKEKILTQNFERLTDHTLSFILTEKSSGVGLTNNITAHNFYNNHAYLFRIAAINCAGIGQYGYSDIITPFGTNHAYCDIILFLQPDSNDISSSLYDYSCRTKTSHQLAGVIADTNTGVFGPGSLYFNGLYDEFPEPGTYPHIKVDHSSNITGDSWSLLDDFTIEFWFKPSSSAPFTSNTIASSYSQSQNGFLDNSNFWKIYHHNNNIGFNAIGANNLIDFIISGISIPTGLFTHVALCRSSGYIRFFINGEQKNRTHFNHDIIIDSDYMIIGANQTYFYVESDINSIGRGTVDYPFIGYLDDFMFSNSARYRKSFVPIKYTETSDCGSCGGYNLILSTDISNDFIP